MSHHPSHTGRCAVAVLASREVSAQTYLACLSEREQARYAAIGHPERQARWLVGRLAAKYLFLMQMNRAGAIGDGPPVLVPLTADHLTAFLPWMYRHVEVLPDEGPSDGAPRLRWDGAACPDHRLSLAHANGTTCACLAAGNTLGIDLEEAVPRIHAFYRGNFTEGEQRWVGQCASAARLSPNWLYTLLWTLKESVLKAKVLEQQISVWDFPRIEVQLRADPQCLVDASRRARLGDHFLICRARVTGPALCAEVRVATTATRKLILTVLNT